MGSHASSKKAVLILFVVAVPLLAYVYFANSGAAPEPATVTDRPTISGQSAPQAATTASRGKASVSPGGQDTYQGDTPTIETQSDDQESMASKKRRPKRRRSQNEEESEDDEVKGASSSAEERRPSAAR